MNNCFKKLSCIFVLAFAMFTLFSSEASAQLWFGGGLVYGAEINNIGVQANGHLVVNEENKLRIGADITYFLREKNSFAGIDVKTNVFTINVNGHYMLVTSDIMILYALGGLNLAFVSQEVDGVASEFVNEFGDDTEIGLNIGGGLEYTVPFGRIYGELKYSVGGFDQLAIGAGVRIPITKGN